MQIGLGHFFLELIAEGQRKVQGYGLKGLWNQGRLPGFVLVKARNVLENVVTCLRERSVVRKGNVICGKMLK